MCTIKIFFFRLKNRIFGPNHGISNMAECEIMIPFSFSIQRREDRRRRRNIVLHVHFKVLSVFERKTWRRWDIRKILQYTLMRRLFVRQLVYQPNVHRFEEK